VLCDPERLLSQLASILAFKSEVVLAAQLVTRHRAPRLAALLAVIIVALSRLGGEAASSGQRTLLLISGIVASVAGSRLLTPGAALACAYRVAAPWWLVPAGRLVGALIVTLPVVAVGCLVTAPSSPIPLEVGLGLVGYHAAVTAATLAVTPVLGGSAAAVLGFLAVWLGMASPAVVQGALDGWPVLQGPVVLLWNTLPLSWRAARWMQRGGEIDILFLLAWAVAGVAVAAWTARVAHRSRRQSQCVRG
jgi:hypothetical protein